MARPKKLNRQAIREKLKAKSGKGAKRTAGTTKPDNRPGISHAELAQLVESPAQFIKLCWPEMSVYPKQLEVIESVRDNAQTFVHAANEMGKTRIAAVTALWFFCRANPVYVVATSSSETQLRNILWNEIRKLVSTSRVRFPFEISDLLIRKINPDENSPEKYIPQNSIVGTVSRTVESFQGYHLPHDKARVLAIFEEACHDDETEVLTRDGWLLFRDLTPAAELCTMDPATGDTTFRRPTALQASHYAGEMFECDGPDANFRVTPNHRMLYRTPDDGRWRMDEIQNIDAETWIIPRNSAAVEVTDAMLSPSSEAESFSRFSPYSMNLIESRHLKRTPYDGMIYCATVPPHHTLFTRRRGSVMWSGNSGIDDEFKTASDSWAHRHLVIGNPLSTTNFFYRGCKGGDTLDPSGECSLLRRVIHIDGMDSPNVKLGLKLVERGYKGPPWPILIPGLLSYPEFLRRSHEWDEVQRQTRLRGLFYEGQDALLFPMQWLDAAQAHGGVVSQFANRRARAMGIDVAMGGRDNTVWTLIDEHGVIDQIVMDTPNTMEIPGRTINLIREHRLSPDSVAIDLGGGGKQIFDRLAELRVYIRGVYFGAAAGSDEDDENESQEARKSYLNKRAEMYGLLRKTLNPVMLAKGGKETRDRPPFAIPPFAHELRKELAVLPLMYDSEGRLFLPPKERSRAKGRGGVCLRDLLGRSPDRADSLVLAIYAAKYGSLGQYWTYSHATAATATATTASPPADDRARKVIAATEAAVQRQADMASRVAALAARLRQ